MPSGCRVELKKPASPQSEEAEEVKRLREDISTPRANGAGRSENRKRKEKEMGEDEENKNSRTERSRVW